MWRPKAHRLHRIRFTKKYHRNAHSPFAFTPYFVGVCGGSGSGKSTFCKQMVQLLGEERVLHICLDDYYKDLTHISFSERVKINFDHPKEIDFPLLTAHLDELFFGKQIVIPQYDFVNYTRKKTVQIVTPKPIVLVEGLFLLFNDDIQKRLNHKVFIDTPENIRLERKLIRDVKERGRTAETVEFQFRNNVSPMHSEFVEPHKTKADRVISGLQPFEVEIRELCLKILKESAT